MPFRVSLSAQNFHICTKIDNRPCNVKYPFQQKKMHIRYRSPTAEGAEIKNFIEIQSYKDAPPFRPMKSDNMNEWRFRRKFLEQDTIPHPTHQTPLPPQTIKC